MGYVALNGLGLRVEKDLVLGKRRRTSAVTKVLGPPVIPLDEMKEMVARHPDIPGASLLKRMTKSLETIREIQETVPAVLVTTTESLPLPRPADQYVKPPVSIVVKPRIVNKPQYQDVTDSPPGPTQTVLDTYVTPTALEPRNPSGAPPDSTVIRLTETDDTDRPIAIAEPIPSGVDSFGYLRPSVLSKRVPLRQTDVVHEGTPALERSIIDYAPGTADLLQVQPLLIQTAEEAAAPTFLDVAGAPSWVMPALVAAGLYIFFGSAQTAERRPPRRRRRR